MSFCYSVGVLELVNEIKYKLEIYKFCVFTIYVLEIRNRIKKFNQINYFGEGQIFREE